MITPNPAPAGERFLPPVPTITQVPPQGRPFWHRLLERKFIVSVLLSLSGVIALVSGAAPLSLELILWILFPVLAWVGVEGMLDWRRLTVPQKEGAGDDAARVLLELAKGLLTLQKATPEAKAAEPTPPAGA